jgi:hypothetical protein
MKPAIRSRLETMSRAVAIARALWLLLAALAIGLYLAGIGPKYAELQGPCLASAAECGQRLAPTAAEIARLEQQGFSPQAYALIWMAATVVSGLIFIGVGLAIFALKSNDRGALLVSLTLVLLGASAPMADALARQYPALQIPVASYDYLRLMMFALLFAAFPNGRVVPRLMWVVIILWATRNLVAVFWYSPPAVLAALTDIAWLGLYLTGIAAQVYRYARISTPDERKQTKWAVFGLVVLVATVVLAAVPFLADANMGGVSAQRLIFEAALNIFVLVIPATLTIAIFRNRLWDIDLIIRRTLIYAALTALLALAYFGSVVVLQGIFSALTGPLREPSTLVTVISTLVIAALFVPLRGRVQAVIDRRLYRRKYDAARTLAAFATSARDDVDLDDLTDGLLGVVDEAMRPASVSLWLKAAEARRRPADYAPAGEE